MTKAVVAVLTNLFVRAIPGADATQSVAPGTVVEVLDEQATEATSRDVNQSTHRFRKVKVGTAHGWILEPHLDFNVPQSKVTEPEKDKK